MLPGSLQTMIFGPLVINQSCEASSCKQVVWVWEVIARNLVVVVVLITQLDKDVARLSGHGRRTFPRCHLRRSLLLHRLAMGCRTTEHAACMRNRIGRRR
jgi:hypothetical protein